MGVTRSASVIHADRHRHTNTHTYIHTYVAGICDKFRLSHRLG